jgi:hypothetical protein
VVWIVCELHPIVPHRHPIADEAAVTRMTLDRVLESGATSSASSPTTWKTLAVGSTSGAPMTAQCYREPAHDLA